MPVDSSQNGKSLILKHPSGSSAEILLFGATIISWKSRTGGPSSELTERLFVSSKAFLDGSKAVRGGIPVVFPFFGAPTKPEHSKLPQHGFARSETWSYDDLLLDSDAGVSVKLSLKPSLMLSSDPVSLAYVVTLTEHQLSTDIHVTNTAPATSGDIEFQALLHTYIRAPAADVRVKGLKGLTYTDKTKSGTPTIQEERDLVDVKNFTDFVYENGPRQYELTWPGGGMEIKAIGFKDVVIWNPNVEAGRKLSDMEEGGWEKFICVEPGYVAGWAKVKPEETWIGGQTLEAVGGP